VRFCIHKPGFRDASDNPAFSIIVCGRYCLPVHCASRLPNWVYSTLASFGSGRRRNLCPRRRHVFGRFSGRHTPFFSHFFQKKKKSKHNKHTLAVYLFQSVCSRVCAFCLLTAFACIRRSDAFTPRQTRSYGTIVCVAAIVRVVDIVSVPGVAAVCGRTARILLFMRPLPKTPS